MKLGRIAVIWLRIMLTITLYWGRREAMRWMSVMPSRAPNGWFDTVMKAPSGRLSSTFSLSMRSLMLKSSRRNLTNSGPGWSKPREWTSLTLSTSSQRNTRLTSFSWPLSLGTISTTSSASSTVRFTGVVSVVSDIMVYLNLRDAAPWPPFTHVRTTRWRVGAPSIGVQPQRLSTSASVIT